MTFSMSNPNTIAVMVTLPEDIVKRIERIISVTRKYSNKPDFITTAIRDTLDDCMKFELQTEHDGLQYQISILPEINNFVNLVETDCELMRVYGKKKDPKSVMIKIPSGLIELITIDPMMRITRKDFAKYSIVRYLSKLGPGWDYTYSLFDGNLNDERKLLTERIARYKNEPINKENLNYRVYNIIKILDDSIEK